MTGWTLFFILILIAGSAVLTAQLFRLLDLIDRPARRSRSCRLPEARSLLFWNAFRNRVEKRSWMFWKS